MRYKVKGHPGVAFFISGYPKYWEPYNYYAVNPETHLEYLVEDPIGGEWIEDRESNRVFVTMVGDDHRFEVDKNDLIPLDDSEYCQDCGQTGCVINVISED